MSRLKLVEDSQFPNWMRRTLPSGGQSFQTNTILRKYRLNTVCEEAKCPNRMECYHKQTATFLVLGKTCTRNCGFCDIDFDKTPKAPEEDEPQRVALSVRELGLKHVVITMVARDDLPDGGAAQIAAIIRSVRKENSGVTIEVLTSDFSGNFDAINLVLAERPEIFNHNIETVRSLSPRIRHKAEYDRSLAVLRHAKQSQASRYVKSGIMLGFDETEEEVFQALRDLHDAGCSIVTIGQYLQPSQNKLRVKKFVHPDQFKIFEEFGLSLGIKQMYCGPYVRSSYNASHVFDSINSLT